jgi:ATP-binding cassette, subfamily C (CFTR/MRP), member 1
MSKALNRSKEEWPVHKEDNEWYFIKAAVSWVWPLIHLATQRSLLEEDVPREPKDHNTATRSSQFWDAWKAEEERAQALNNSHDGNNGKVAVPSLLWALWGAYKAEFYTGSLAQLGFCVTQFAQPYLIAELVGWIASGEGGIKKGLTIAALLAAASTLSSILMSFNLFAMRRTGMAVRSGTMMACYQQTLQLTATSRASLTIGKTTSMLAIDCEKLLLASMFIGYLWHGPVAALVAMLLLVQEVGWLAAMAGLLWICILIPSQTIVARHIGSLRRKMMACTDERVKLSNELLSAIRLIKFYNWEVPLSERCLKARNEETTHLFQALCLNGTLRELLFISGPVCSAVIFSIYIYGQGKEVNLRQVFRVLAMINVLRFPLNLLGQALKFCQEGLVSSQRLHGYFLLPTTKKDRRIGSGSGFGYAGNNDDNEVCTHPRIEFNNMSFAWGELDGNSGYGTASGYNAIPNKDSDTTNGDSSDGGMVLPRFVLQDINIKLGGKEEDNKSSLIAVIGNVGSGKSAFLSSILGEMPLLDMSNNAASIGAVVEGSIAYCSQQPWIQNMTLRDNITFGYDYYGIDSTVKRDYDVAVSAAALLPDIEILRQGDLTEIGERGVNLSGGQKARVSIARALFIALRRANIILLDDPFSAVDGETGNNIFHSGVMKLLRHSTSTQQRSRITVICLNSHLHLLPYFDRILCLDNGKIVMDGSPTELACSDSSAGTDNALTLAAATGIDVASMRALVEGVERNSTPPPEPEDSTTTVTNVSLKAIDIPVAQKSSNDGAITKNSSHEDRISDGKIIKQEHRELGSVKWRIYLDYFGAAFWPLQRLTYTNVYTASDAPLHARSNHSPRTFFSGLTVTIGLLILFTAAQASRVVIDYALASWAENNGRQDSPWAARFYYSFLTLFLLLCVRSFYLNFWSYYSTRAVHQSTFLKIIQAPVTTFFDTHTVGEVLNKLSRDTEIMDSMVPEFLLQFIINLEQVLFTFGLCIWSSPWIALGFVPLIYGFKKCSEWFSCVSRDLKRMESISRSPIFSSLSETLSGLDTIRAYGDVPRFLQTHMKKMDRNSKFYFHIWMSTSWMTLRLELTTAAVLMSVSLLAVFLRETTSPIILGLALSYGLQLTALFQRCVQLAIDVGVFMTSVERIMEYLVIPQEISLENINMQANIASIENEDDVELTQLVPASTTTTCTDNKTINVSDENWPQTGNIEFKNVFFRYRDNPHVLSDLSFTIKSGERVGICGRTGAGKSSIIFALFRMAQLDGGSIYIDGDNINTHVPLCLLRSKMAIIPQDPVLLTGTIRFQLDPLLLYTDEEIWNALETVNMSVTVKSMSNGLQETVQEGGGNLSHGQRQLICIARALLRKAKILVVDEGTSAVDPTTDELIQKALRLSSSIHGTTVIAIAHRLQTIKDFDKVMVMSAGKVLEYDAPRILLNDSNSIFAAMLRESEQEQEEMERDRLASSSSI